MSVSANEKVVQCGYYGVAKKGIHREESVRIELNFKFNIIRILVNIFPLYFVSISPRPTSRSGLGETFPSLLRNHLSTNFSPP
jgi:hypothetical protein